MLRTKNSIKNMKFSLFFRFLRIFAAFFRRKIFVLMLTQEYLGLNGTFSNILDMLSIAELGIGGAITYSLYKPLAERDEKQIAARMTLFRRTYHIIGLAIILLGGALTPFLPLVIRDFPDIPHIYLIYLLFLSNSALSYFFSYKQALIVADQRQYIITTCSSLLSILLYFAQALFLWLTKNYFFYLGLQIIVTMLENLIITYIANQRYPYLKANRDEPIEAEAKREIVKNTKAMIIHKMGDTVILGADTLLISSFFGTVLVGLHSNYMMITLALASVYNQFFSALVASAGNLGATAEPKHVLRVFQRVDFAGNWLYGFSAVCLTVLLNPFIELWLGEDYLFDQRIVCLIVLNFYLSGMRRAVLTFKDAEGLYWQDRYKAVVEALINLTVSMVLAAFLGIAGIFIGTTVSLLATSFWIEPMVVFKYGFHCSARSYFLHYIENTLITLLTIIIVWRICEGLPGTGLPLFIGKMVMCVVVGNMGYLAVYCRRDEFRYFVWLLRNFIFQKKKR